jgi:hypothetical protein
MRAVSAVDSVSLAIQRTRDFLFRPFSWGTYLKLGLVAIVTEGVGSHFQSSTHNDHSSGSGPVIQSLHDLPALWVAEGVAAVLLLIVISLWLAYLITRLRFAFFHCLTRNTREIRPGWHLYRPQASRFFWMNVAVGLCFVLLVAVVAAPFAAGFWQLFQQTQQSGHLNVWLLLSLVLPLIPILLLLALAAFLADVILRDCMMPHYALENATAGQAWSQVRARIQAEKRQFIVYALLRVALPIVAMAGVFMVLFVPGLAVAGAFAGILYGIHSTFADATGAAAVVGVLIQVFFGVVAFFFFALFSICVGGPVSTGIREFALIFYGGRYQTLGDMLYPPPPPAIEGTPHTS